MDDSEFERLLLALKEWANSHPSNGRPIFSILEEYEDEEEEGRGSGVGTHISAKEFVYMVSQRVGIGRSYLEFLDVQSKEYDIPPSDFVWRSVEANRAISRDGEGR